MPLGSLARVFFFTGSLSMVLAGPVQARHFHHGNG